jgi:hypothetical protein
MRLPRARDYFRLGVAALMFAAALLSMSCSRAAPSTHLRLSDFHNLAVPTDEGQIQLRGGTADMTYSDASRDHYYLSTIYAEGDFNDSARPDAAIVLVDASSGSGIFYSLVPVLNTETGFVAQKPEELGDRIVIQQLHISKSVITAKILDRSPDQPYTQVDQQRTLKFYYHGSSLAKTSDTVTPLTQVPLPTLDISPQAIRLASEASTATVDGQIPYGERRAFTLHCDAGQTLHAEIIAPLGVFLTGRDPNNQALTQQSDRVTKFDRRVAVSGQWQLEVASLNGEASPFTLRITMS